MGYNAGGCGTMAFPDEASVAKWKQARVSHSAFKWPDELDSASAPDETVAKRLARIARGHSAKTFSIQEVGIDGARVTLTWDTGEDAFRETVGDFAALVRSAAAFGAKGTFFFLGTAGAEGDFAWAVTLDGRSSKVAAVPREAHGRRVRPRLRGVRRARDPTRRGRELPGQEAHARDAGR